METAVPQPAPTTQNSRLSRLRGAAALCAFVFAGLLVGSGIGLAMSYVPSQTEAFASVLYIRQQGSLVDPGRIASEYFRLLARDPEALAARTRTDKDIFQNRDGGLPRARCRHRFQRVGKAAVRHGPPLRFAGYSTRVH